MMFQVEEFLVFLFLAAMIFFACVYVTALLWDWWAKWRRGVSRWVCRLCGMRFYVRRGTGTHECPHCGALNSGQRRFRR